MDNSGVKIQYGNITMGAKENFVPVVNSKTSWTDLEQLQRYNLRFPNYGNPCEYGSVLTERQNLCQSCLIYAILIWGGGAIMFQMKTEISQHL